jgi:hypothetical protein
MKDLRKVEKTFVLTLRNIGYKMDQNLYYLHDSRSFPIDENLRSDECPEEEKLQELSDVDIFAELVGNPCWMRCPVKECPFKGEPYKSDRSLGEYIGSGPLDGEIVISRES